MAWRRAIVALLVLVAIGVGAWWAWQTWFVAPPGGEGQEQGGVSVPVDSAKVRSGTLLRRIEAVGTLAANERATLGPEFAGLITAIEFREGQDVAKGAVLFRLDDTILQAELDQAKASLALSEQNYKRAADLAKRGAGTQRAHDEALSNLQFDRAAVALAETRIRKMVIAAPFKGVVGLREVSIGDYVQVGDPLVTLQDIELLKVDFRVPELFLVEVSVGQELRIRVDALGGEAFAGKVYAIDPQVDVNGRALVIRATLDNKQRRLRPGLFARVDVILERRENALIVPEAALWPTRDGFFVYKVVEGVVELVPVKIGLRQEAEVEILEGLAEGDVVVTGGQIKLQPGMPVMTEAPGQEPGATSAGGGEGG